MRVSFRRGLALGLFAGVVLALVKTMRSRRASPADESPSSWPPLVEAPPPTTATATRPVPAPPQAPVAADPVVSAAATDVAAAPGPEPQPDRRESDADRPAADEQATKRAGGTKKAAGTRKAGAQKTPGTSSARAGAPWVAPDADGGCPTSHPVKGKLSSKIFHLPGMLNYARTTPDRCYLDEAAAEGDGLRKAKR